MPDEDFHLAVHARSQAHTLARTARRPTVSSRVQSEPLAGRSRVERLVRREPRFPNHFLNDG
jgi:hypothetical protein